MFCNQCEQAFRSVGCSSVAVCGKSEQVSDLFDLILYQCKGIAWLLDIARRHDRTDYELDRFVIESLFLTITNVNFDQKAVVEWVYRADEFADKAAALAGMDRFSEAVPPPAHFIAEGMSEEDLLEEAKKYPITKLNPNDDLQSLIQLLIYGLKGMAAYAKHALNLGVTDESVYLFISEALSVTIREDITADELIALNMKCGEVNIRCMEMLNEAHIDHYGTPEPTSVSTGSKAGPAVVVSGHDMYMMEQLLTQCDAAGVNVYTHGEMLPAHGYPKLKAHPSLVGHFGTAWQNQRKEFDGQPAAFVFNTNCIMEPKESYQDRIFTSSVVGFPGTTHIDSYDFSPVIAKAKELGGFEEKECGTLMTGFGHDAILSVADKVIEGVKAGAIKHFFVVGGCDGAKPGRNYFTDFVENTPNDTVVLTLACGKYRFNHLQEQMGDIGGIPRLLDVGQCNDAYSGVRVAMALAEAFDCDLNDLPLSYIISWYEQKAVVVLLSLLYLGVKGIRLGPSLPAFITPAILDFLIENFDIKPIGNSAKGDLEEILGS